MDVASSTPRIVVLVALALLVVCAAAYGISEAITKTSTATLTIPRHVDRVVVDAATGDVRLRGGSGTRVMVREDRTWVWGQPTVRTRLTGSTLLISGSCPRSGPVNRCRMDLTLTIPFDADLKVTADAGDIRADQLAGHMELDTAAGDVTGALLNPVSLRATTDAGDIVLDFTTQPVSVTAVSDAGDVDLTLPGGGEYRVDATTDDGNVVVEGILRNDRSLRSISATTSAGDVHVHGN